MGGSSCWCDRDCLSCGYAGLGLLVLEVVGRIAARGLVVARHGAGQILSKVAASELQRNIERLL